MVTTTAAQLAESVTRDPDHLRAILDSKTLGGQFKGVYLGDEAGKFTTAPDHAMPVGYDPRKRPWYKAAVAADTAILTAPYIDASTGQPVVTAAVPVKHGDALAGVVVFVSSDHDDASATVATLAERLGFAAIEVGRIAEGGRLIQARAPLVFQNLIKYPL